MTDDARKAALESIAREVAVCQRCRLAATRTRAVPGEGNPDTEVMFVGEGPGFNEDRQGRPFVGQAGNLLTELLGSVGWERDEVFITNVVKCRPPENRDPEPDEIAACAPFLARQLEVLEPALVVTLGRFSMARFNPGARIGQVHGTFKEADPSSGAGDAYTFAMYHPAAALHQGSLKQTLFGDMRSVPAALIAAREAREARAAERAAVETEPQPVEASAGSPESSAWRAEAPAEPAEPVAFGTEPAPSPSESVDLPPGAVESGPQPVEPEAASLELPSAAPADPPGHESVTLDPASQPLEAAPGPVTPEPAPEPVAIVPDRSTAESVASQPQAGLPTEAANADDADRDRSASESAHDPLAQLTLF